MSSTGVKLARRKKAKEIINSLVSSSTVLVIHYSCESFYDIKDGRTPRITSIAVRYLKTGQTKSFSIHKLAERKKIAINKIEEHYDELEKDMLNEFFKFVKEHEKAYKWVHWNMRDMNFGFEAIKNRFAVLGGTPKSIQDENKFDLARLLVDIYGLKYIGHSRMEKLIDKNKITKKDFLTGAEEAKAFDNKEYVKLHQSTLRKVDCMNTILERTADGSLKTEAKITDIYGLSPQGISELAKDHWLVGLVFSLVGIVIGALLSKVLG